MQHGRDGLDACGDDLRCLIGHLTGVLDRLAEGGGGPAPAPAGKARRRFWQSP